MGPSNDTDYAMPTDFIFFAGSSTGRNSTQNGNCIVLSMVSASYALSFTACLSTTPVSHVFVESVAPITMATTTEELIIFTIYPAQVAVGGKKFKRKFKEW